MKNYTKITKEIYECAKTLFKGGATTQEVANYLKIGISTAGRIKKSETLEEYKQIQALMVANWKGNKKKKAEQKADPKPEQKPETKPEEKPQTFNVSGQYTMNRMTELLKEQNEMLKIISNKLAFIVEQLA